MALIDRGKVLLIQRAFAPFAGAWTLPGGRREADESIERTAIREVLEELGLRIFGLRPVLAMDVGGGTGFRLQVFATEGFEGEIRPSDEIADHRWLLPRQAAGLTTTPGLAGVLERAVMMFDRT